MGGKRKGKVKFKNAAEAQKARDLDASWKELQKKWGVEQEDKKRKRALAAETLTYKLSAPVGRSTSNHIPSHSTPGGSTSSVHKVYTGDKIIGISQMAKSNAIPVFNSDHILEIARMRR
jgi:hypothetical protein